MAYKFTSNEDRLELLQIIKKFIEKEVTLIRAEIMMNQENHPGQILQ